MRRDFSRSAIRLRADGPETSAASSRAACNIRAASDSVSGPTGWSFPPGPASHTSPDRSVTATTSGKLFLPNRHSWRSISLPDAGGRVESHRAKRASNESIVTDTRSRTPSGAPAPSTGARRPVNPSRLSTIASVPSLRDQRATLPFREP